MALLDSLHRTSSGCFHVKHAWTVEQVCQASQAGKRWDELTCWLPFDQLLQDYCRAQATKEEQAALSNGKQEVLNTILERIEHSPQLPNQINDCVAIYCANALIATARKHPEAWRIERVFNEF